MITDTALILEGGGMRGVYTAGVLDYFLDRGLMFSPIYGVSAGACHACSYISGQRGRAAKTVLDYVGDRRYVSYRNLLLTGDIFGVEFVYRTIPDRLLPYDYDAYRDRVRAGVRFRAAITNCVTGQAEYPLVEDLRRDMALIQASSSLPLVSRKVMLGGTPYLDGGVADSIPTARAGADGFPRQVVILTQHRDFVKSPTGSLSAIRLRYRRYPELVRSLALRHERYNAALAHIRREEAAGNLFVIAPARPVTVGRMEKNRDKLAALYEQGYREIKARSAELAAFLDPAGVPEER